MKFRFDLNSGISEQKMTQSVDDFIHMFKYYQPGRARTDNTRGYKV